MDLQKSVNLKKSIKYLLIILSLLAFHAINNIAVINMDKGPLYADSADLFESSLKYWELFNRKDLDSYNAKNRFVEFVDSTDRTPLLPLVATVNYYFFGVSEKVAIHTNLLYLALMFICTYYIGIYFFKNKKIALFSVFLLSMYPIIFGMSRVFIRDYSAISLNLLSTLILLGNKKRTVAWGILSGVIIGLTLLNRVTNIFFIVWPLFYFIKETCKLSKNKRISILAGFFLSSGLIMSIWYPLGFIKYLSDYKIAWQSLSYARINIFSFKSLTYYFDSLINNQIYGFFSFIFAISLIIIFQKKLKTNIKSCFILIFIPLLFFTFIASKQNRFTISYLPYIALITSYGIFQIKNKIVLKILLSLTVLVSFSQFIIINYSKLGPKIFKNVHAIKAGSDNSIHLGLLSPIEESIKHSLVNLIETHMSYHENLRIWIMEENGFVEHPIKIYLGLKDISAKIKPKHRVYSYEREYNEFGFESNDFILSVKKAENNPQLHNHLTRLKKITKVEMSGDFIESKNLWLYRIVFPET